MRVGPQTPPGAAKGKPVPPPTKQCRNCGARSDTFETKCPNCGRSYGTSPWGVAAAIAAACVAVLLLLGGCAALVVVGLNKAEDEIDEDAITKQQFDLIDPGTPESVVRARLGDPLSEESFNRPRLDCIYYAQKDEGLFGIDDFEFCFRDGVLASKAVN